MSPVISVIVPAYNEEGEISACLAALSEQVAAEAFEVIVVDNGSTDKTSEVAQRFSSQLDIRVVPEPKKGRGQARATGCRVARGEIFFSTDADAKVPPEWLSEMTKKLRDTGAVAVVSNATISDCRPITNWLFNVGAPLYTFLYRVCAGHYFLPGFSFAIRRDIYELSGGFNPELNAMEDVELSWRVQKFGAIRLVRNVKIVFSGRRFRKGFFRGVWGYVPPFVDALRHRTTATLSDIRE